MNIKNKKSMEGGIWWIILSAIVAVVVAGIIIYIVKGGLSAGGKNIDSLAKCESQGGRCAGADSDGKSKCKPNEASYHNFGGCSLAQYCCIPKQT